MKNKEVNIKIRWGNKKRTTSKSRKLIKKYGKKIWQKKFLLPILGTFGFLQYSDIFPILDKINIPHSFTIQEVPPKIYKSSLGSIKNILNEADYNQFLEDESGSISEGIFNSEFTDSPFFSIRIKNDKPFFNMLRSVEIYEFKIEYKMPLKVLTIPIDDASNLGKIDLYTDGNENFDYRSFYQYFTNNDGTIVLNYFTPASAFVRTNDSEKKDPTIFYLVFNQGIGNIIKRNHIVSYYHDLSNDVFEKIDKKEMILDTTLFENYKKYKTSKKYNMNMIWAVKTGYDYLSEELSKK